MIKQTLRYKWLVFAVLIWIISLCVPSLRYHLRAWFVGSPWLQFTVVPNGYWDARFHQDAKELPLVATEINNKVYSEKFKALDDLDRLIDRNPNVAWLVAMRLRATMSVFARNRVGGELSDSERKEHQKQGVPSPEKTDITINFTPAQLNKTLALCTLGEKLEPQNAFFSWVGTASVLALLLLIGQTVLDQQLEPWGNEQVRGQMHAIHQVQNGAP